MREVRCRGHCRPSGAEQGDKRSAEDAREYVRLRSLLVDQILRDVLFSLLHAAQLKLGGRDARLLIDMTAVAHEHARPYLPGELTRQIGQGPDSVAGSGVRGKPREPARRAGGERSGPGPSPAADRCSAVTPPARHAASLPYELRDVREPPICA
jgi:hypothetical protein